MLPKFVHPEKRDGEIYLGNFTHDDYLKIVFRSKREGEKSFTESGQSYPFQSEWNVYPVFVLKSEREDHIAKMQGVFYAIVND